jgi:F0F1-type ATP synthase delta subunit
VTAFVEHYVADTPAKVVDVEVEIDQGITEIDIVVASSLSAPSVDALAEQLAEYLSSPVEVRLLVASTVTERATSVP